MSVDLHLHSSASDGTLTAPEIVATAARLGLSAISITDHDTLDALPSALVAALRLGIEVVPGLEMSCIFGGADIHILGYFIDYHDSRLIDELVRLRQAREERAVKILEKLAALGLAASIDEVRALAGTASVGRPHIAQVLVKRGYVDSIADAFERYLRRGAPAYVEKYTLPVDEVIALIRASGGLPVFAHPALSNSDAAIAGFVGQGLAGIEVYHSDHTAADRGRYLEIAARLDLVATGGSDSHGPGSGKDFAIGSVPVPDHCVADLKRRLSR